MTKSNIEWTDRTWNPVTGCTKVSDGCKNCYAKRDWLRLQHLPRYNRPFEQVECHPDRLDQPLHWQKPSKIFVCHNGDLFHESVSDDFIADVFNIMAEAKQHIFQVLTKRPERMRDFMLGTSGCGADNDPIPNIWYGVSIENQQTADERIPPLLQIPAAVRWLSIEPILAPVDLRHIHYDLESPSWVDALAGLYLCDGLNEPRTAPRIDWVVLGGESGPNARPMHPNWIRTIRDQCQAASVPFFFKQWGAWIPVDLDTARNVTDWMIVDKHGGIDIPDYRAPRKEIGEIAMRQVGKKKVGRTLDNQTWEEYPKCQQPSK